ncbi:amine dehydrogenase large subunit [Hirschia baltica]|uniref:Amine dehydrogenase n=1 Tax=Hirschia baltica (strain ATCC 49814 / DSM 5838 / IFAM 1418) TaxID=582402 RepID=C6XQB5_HIRBI|nr:amine dehydrogenase large subunit [Hirschia baltica]ACT60414.1 amine dehydrogenase [Hirschia baltica ATCC 49814]
MSLKSCALGALIFLASPVGFAQEPIAPEELTVEKEIPDGENVYVLSSSWAGASSVLVLSADDLSYKGNIPAGLTPQVAMLPGNEEGYIVSAFAERMMYGPVSAYLQKFDVKTLAFEQEVEMLPRMAQVAAQVTVLALSSDGKWAFVQNATPATSVSVVKLSSGEVVDEIPNPGCWGIYPSTSGSKYSTLCGDGAMVTYVIGSDGKFLRQKASEPIFDVETKPLFSNAQRDGINLMFISYDGSVVTVSDEGTEAVLRDEWKFNEGIEGNWAPGGYELSAFNEPNGILFVLMHSDAKDGSHKNGAEEMWALDIKNKKVLYRSAVEHIVNISVNQAKDKPLVFGTDSHDSGLYKYEVDPEAKFAAKLTAEFDLKGVGYLVAEK